jgi:predicted alpha/beta hydrolase family esterase
MPLTLDFRRGSGLSGRMLPPNAGVWLNDGTPVPLSQVQRQTECRRGAVFICGYNSPERGAVQSYRLIEESLRRRNTIYDFIVWVHWPTSIAPTYHLAELKVYWDGLLPGISWWQGVGNRLRNQLRELEFESLDVFAHSLGCGVILDALREGSVRRIRHLFLAAPAVESTSLSTPRGRFVPSVQSINGQCVIFSSPNDPVLAHWYLRAKLFTRTALGHSGPMGQTPANVIHVSMPQVKCHGGHRHNGLYYAVIAGVVNTQKSPRFP